MTGTLARMAGPISAVAEDKPLVAAANPHRPFRGRAGERGAANSDSGKAPLLSTDHLVPFQRRIIA